MSLIRKAFLVNTTQFVCIALGVIQSMILARVLGPAAIGRYALVYSVAILTAAMSCLGVPQSMLYHCQHDKENTKKYLINALWMLACLSSIGGIVLVLLLLTQTDYFGVLPGYVLVIVFAYVPSVLWLAFVRHCLLIKIQARRLSAMRLGRDSGGLFLVSFFWIIGALDISQAILCFVAACSIPALLGWKWIRNLVDFSMRPGLNIGRKLIIMGVRLNWTDLMILVSGQVSVFMIRYLLTDFEKVGYFTRGLSLAMFAVTAGQCVLPLLFSRWAAFPEEHLADHVEKVMRFASTLAIAVIIFILFGGKWVILLMYGREFLPAVVPMMILVPGTVLYLVSRVLMQLLSSRGIPEIPASMLLLSALLNAGISWFLIPAFGIAGAALASTVSYIILLVGLTLVVKYKYGVRVAHSLAVNKADINALARELRIGKYEVPDAS